MFFPCVGSDAEVVGAWKAEGEVGGGKAPQLRRGGFSRRFSLASWAAEAAPTGWIGVMICLGCVVRLTGDRLSETDLEKVRDVVRVV
jgi:hypothetical protein